MYSNPFYENVGRKYYLEWPTTILAILATFFIIPVRPPGSSALTHLTVASIRYTLCTFGVQG